MPALPGHRAALRALALVTALVSACADYAVTFNDRPLYTPPGLFGDFELADEALRRCVTQHIIDQSVREAGELTTLNCSHGGIVSLAGLEVFTGLTHVRLSANAIADVAPLTAAGDLEVLLLDDNRIADAAPLWQLDALSRLDLGGNADLACPSAPPPVEDLLLPSHCP